MGEVSKKAIGKNKIVLVRPKNDFGGIPPLPLGLLHVGTMAYEAGYDVKIIDNARQSDYKQLLSTHAKDSLLFGITALTTEVNDAIATSDYIKSICDAPIVWGGWHPTLFPEQTCADKSVDFVCVGEGELVILELARALQSRSPFKEIDGLTYKDHGEVKVNQARKFLDMDQLPLLNYDLIDLEKYIGTDLGGQTKRTLLYQSSRGCPHRCSFCINAVTGNRKWRRKSAQKVVDEIMMAIGKYDVKLVHFIDDNFFVSIDRVKEICQEILKRGLRVSWGAECRADYFKPGFIDEEFLTLAENSGMMGLGIGAESGSQRMLDLIDKDLIAEQILMSATIIGRHKNIEVSYGFIIGIPGETKEDLLSTVKLANKIVEACPQAIIGLNMLTPYPRCQLTDDLIKQGFFREPKTLREWCADNVRELYAGRFSPKPWSKHPQFLKKVGHFVDLSYRAYARQKLVRNYCRRAGWRIDKYLELVLILIARIRVRRLLFSFPLDKIIYELYVRVEATPQFLLRNMKKLWYANIKGIP